MPVIERGVADECNFVNKAVNRAVRQIGKRNRRFNGLAIETGERIEKLESKPADG